MDTLTPEHRSWNMSRIRGKDNRSTELRLVQLFREAGITGWRRHQRVLIGKPDFLFREERLVVFVDGCYWHRHPGCKDASTPKTRTDFWKRKMDGNVKRDRKVNRQLRAEGWSVCRIWECNLQKKPDQAIRKIRRMLGR